LNPLDDGWICEAMMQAFCGTEKDRATLPRIVADGQDVIEVLPVKFFDVFRPVRGDIDPHFFHDRNRFSPHDARLRAGAFHLKPIPRIMP
jgi:hypothetical protein